jgi:hypothetical protein
VRYDDDKSALPAWVCVKDAAEKSAKSRELYEPSWQEYGEFIKGRIESSYFRSKVYMDFRDKFISITVHKPVRQDLVSSEVFCLDDYIETRGIEKVRTAKGNIVYRVKRADLPTLVGEA